MPQNKLPVRHGEAATIDAAIEQDTLLSLRLAANNPHRIHERLQEIEGEWDIERSLQLNLAVASLTGILLGIAHRKSWLVLPFAVSLMLAQHSLTAWCPALPLLRRLGIRTRREVNREQLALQLLRGDFGHRYNNADRVWGSIKTGDNYVK